MPQDKKEGKEKDKPNHSVDVNAEKVGVVGSGARIEKQDFSTTYIIYNYPKEQEQHKSASNKEHVNLPANPYMGLAHFGPKEADLFFGRDDIIEKLTSTISENRFTAVIGPSGSGKSSVVLAGVAPRLFSQGEWLFSYFRVSDNSVNDPFLAISQALIPYFDAGLNGVEQLREAKKLAQYLFNGEVTLFDVCDKIRQNFPQKRLLLIADQFEELYTTGVTQEVQEKFISLLVTTLNNQAGNDEQRALSMVVTLRADFLEQAAANATLATLIDSSAHIIGPMGREQLRLAIEEPARLKGVHFEAGLVDAILDDVGEAHGNLPLVEFALRLLWEKQQNQVISVTAYHALGRVKGALSLHAQGIYESLSNDQQKAAKRIFTQLVKIGSGTGDTRRTASKSDFSSEDWTLLQRFANESHRLIVTNKNDEIETAEVVHETLIRQWPLLRQWINESRLYLSWLDNVRRAIKQWHEHGKDTDSLLRGVALGQAQDNLSNKSVNIPANVREYIQLSERQQYKEIHKVTRRNRLLAVSALVTIIVLAILGGYLFDSRNQQIELTIKAKTQTVLAQSERDKQLVTQSRLLADLSRRHTENGNSRLGALLALEALPDYSKKAALRRPYVAEAERSLYATFNKPMNTLRLTHDANVNQAAFSPDGSRIVTASSDNTAKVWDSANGKLLHVLAGHTDYVFKAVFSPDGLSILKASGDRTVRMWDSSSGNLLDTLEGHTRNIRNAAFSPNGSRIVTASEDNTARVWDSASGQLQLTLSGHTNEVNDAAFSSDGSRIVTASRDNTARVWDSTNGHTLDVLEDHTQAVAHAFFSPDGSRIVTVSDNTTRVWETVSGQLVLTLEGHTDFVTHAFFSPNGTRIVTTSWDKTARVWNSANGELLHTLEGHTREIINAAFSPDGQRIVTAAMDNAPRVWDSTSGKVMHYLKGHADYVDFATFSPDGSRIITTARDDFSARVWDTDSTIVLPSLILKGHTHLVDHVVFNHDGTRIASVSWDKTARLWDSASGQMLHTLEGHINEVVRVGFGLKGTRIVTVSRENNARLWDSASGKLLHTLEGHRMDISNLAISPDGTRIVTVSQDKTARVWDSASGQMLQILEGHTHYVNSAAFNPRGTRIVTTSMDKTARVWDSANGKLLHTLEGHTRNIVNAAFSPDDRHIVTASGDDTAKIWDGDSGNLIHTLKGHTSNVDMATFSPDSSRILTASSDSTAKIWDGDSGKLIHTLKGHTLSIELAAFSPDGTRIVTASSDSTARIWDTASGQMLYSLEGHSSNVTYAAFSPDGTRVVTACLDRAVRVFNLYKTEELVELFKLKKLHPLTSEERRQSYLD